MIYLFHGLIGGSDHYIHVAKKLREMGHVVRCPELDFQRFDVDELVEQFQTQIYYVQTPVTLVGNSIGCLIAIKLKAANARYVLSAPPFDYDNGSIPLRRSNVSEYIRSLYVGQGAIKDEQMFVHNAEQRLRALLSNRQMIRRIRSLRAQSLSFLCDVGLAQMSDRIHFVIGAEDFTTPPQRFKKFVRDTARGASVSVLNDCGHAIPVENPNAFSEIINAEVEHVMPSVTNWPIKDVV